ncbi:unnamed protein product [marine sediment metagenome]|uniref:Uncharacterized protein n=1 Tax=marine sediment metagenome TaxID=412755 RepID=X1B6Z1_9ZZZZ
MLSISAFLTSLSLTLGLEIIDLSATVIAGPFPIYDGISAFFIPGTSAAVVFSIARAIVGFRLNAPVIAPLPPISS